MEVFFFSGTDIGSGKDWLPSLKSVESQRGALVITLVGQVLLGKLICFGGEYFLEGSLSIFLYWSLTGGILDTHLWKTFCIVVVEKERVVEVKNYRIRRKVYLIEVNKFQPHRWRWCYDTRMSQLSVTGITGRLPK